MAGRRRSVRLTEADAPAGPPPAADELTFDDIRRLVQSAISSWLVAQDAAEDTAAGEDPNADDGDGTDVVYSVWIQDLSPTWAVFQNDSTVADGPGLFRIGYTLDDKGVVTLGTPEKVAQHTTYDKVTEARDRLHGRVLEAKAAGAGGSRVFRVQIIAYGDSKNARRYPEAVMRAAVPLYEGAKAYDHHRTDDELRTSTIQGLVGSYRNVEATPAGIEGDLVLLPSATHTAEALDASLAADADGLPPLVGVSHDVMAKYRPLAESGGRRFMEATEILSVNSADVVADPAAGGRATRMVAGGIDDTHPSKEDDMTLKELLALLRGASPEKRAELLKEHAAVLDGQGITTDDITRILTVEPPSGDAPAADDKEKELVGAATESRSVAGAAEPRYARNSAMGRLLAQTAIVQANLDPRLVESVLLELPATFTESEILVKVGTFQRITEGLEKAGLAPTVPDVKVTKDAVDKKIERLNATFDGDYAHGYSSFKEAYMDFTGYQPRFSDMLGEDFNRKILRESIGALPYDSAVRVEESVSTTTWSTALGDSITRRLVAEYTQPSLQAWRKVVSSMPPVNDFRTQRIDRIGGYGTLPVVNQGAPYQPLTTPGNEEVTYALTKKGGTEDLTLETIANDDIRAVVRIPRLLGLAAAQTLFRFVWDLLNTNPTVYDSIALFHASHANTATTAMSSAAISTGRKAMRKQTAYGDASDVLSITPKYLIVASDLEELAFQVATSAVAIGVNAGTAAGANISSIPNIHQGLEPITVDYWTSTTQWMLVADPALTPTIEVGFYQGRQDPELFVQNDPTVGSVFTSDKITWKIRHIYSGAVLDYRGFYRGNV